MRPEIKSFHRKQLPAFSLMLLSLMLFGSTSAQRVAPGVPPQHYQQVPVQHNQQPQYQQQQQQQMHHAPNVNPQHYQQQVQYQQVPVQQQQQQQYQQQQQPQFQQQQPPQQQQQFQQQPPQPVQQQAPHAPHQAHHGQQQVLNAANIQDERAHIQEHMQVPIDTSKMSEAELQFHYFKMHDSDNNNKLDGCELIKSLIHWHGNTHIFINNSVRKSVTCAGGKNIAKQPANNQHSAWYIGICRECSQAVKLFSSTYINKFRERGKAGKPNTQTIHKKKYK